MRFYLSGGIEHKTNFGSTWRSWITGELEKLGHYAVDPLKLEEDANLAGPVQKYLNQYKAEGNVGKVRELARNGLFRKDMQGIQFSDALIVLYDVSVQKGAGTLAETWEAFREGKPIYLITELPLSEIPTWLIGETTEVFFNFTDLLQYLRPDNFQQVHSDCAQAIHIAHEILGGIYKDTE